MNIQPVSIDCFISLNNKEHFRIQRSLSMVTFGGNIETKISSHDEDEEQMKNLHRRLTRYSDSVSDE